MSTLPGPLRTLDWVPRFDERSRLYPIRAMLPPASTSLSQRTMAQWAPGTILDQGREGACVGFGWTQEAIMSPVRVSLSSIAHALWIGDPPNSVAHAIYKAAQQVDEWDGENYEGTSVLAGAKVMTGLRFLTEYRWCFDMVDVIQTLIHRGPVVLGINWHESMYNPDRNGELFPNGPVVGGHCIVASGYHPNLSLTGSSLGQAMIQLTNSWGDDWGNHGQAWISAANLSQLLIDEQGEACVPVHRSYGRKL